MIVYNFIQAQGAPSVPFVLLGNMPPKQTHGDETMASSAFKTTYIHKSNRVVKWYETREEALRELNLFYAQEFLNKIPHNGKGRPEAVLDHIDELVAKIATADGDITEYPEAGS